MFVYGGKVALADFAMHVIHDEVAPAAPWPLQALFCIMFPCFGVIDTMRKLSPLMPPALSEPLDEQLCILEKLQESAEIDKGRVRAGLTRHPPGSV
eukprot:CAMPEP_0119070566 /NCGR_PEP_ID=MMETSP1178-20130426/41940_1 /TAXON_ID=33656 /ORGANISM="unid sp, Strain CCMP2000" /LENGTH=95 /DNA_ID=CAMNT_0007052413 /DNA_START=136 /DNA_END=424 /DNA_ORIENTATION=-